MPADPLITFRHGLVLIAGLLAGATAVACCLLTARPQAAAQAAGTES